MQEGIMRLAIVIMTVTVGMTFLLASCTDNDVISNPVKTGENVSECVRAFYCDLDENSQLNSGKELRYASATGRIATVEFIGVGSGESVSVSTDDSSCFAVLLDSGLYDIIVECRHAFPDTFPNVWLRHDTILDLKIEYDWMMADTMIFLLSYYPASDSLSVNQEMEILAEVNRQSGNVLILNEAFREVQVDDILDKSYVLYNVPIDSRFTPWESYDIVASVADNPDNNFPETFQATLSFFPCLD